MGEYISYGARISSKGLVGSIQFSDGGEDLSAADAANIHVTYTPLGEVVTLSTYDLMVSNTVITPKINATSLRGDTKQANIDFIIKQALGTGTTVQPSLSVTSPVYITPDTPATINPTVSTNLGRARVIDENDIIVTKDYAGSVASTTVAPFITTVGYGASSTFPFSATFNAGTVVPIDDPFVAYPGGTVTETLVVSGEYPISTTNEIIQPNGRTSLTFTITGTTHYIEIHQDVTTASSITVQIQDDNFNATTNFTFDSVTSGYRKYIDTSIVGNATESYILNLSTL